MNQPSNRAEPGADLQSLDDAALMQMAGDIGDEIERRYREREEELRRLKGGAQ